MVAIAVPIWDDPREQVIGVMARTIHLTELLQQWEVGLENGAAGPATPAPGDPSRFLVLADTRGGAVKLLDHPWMTHDHLAALPEAELESPSSPLRVEAAQGEALRQARAIDTYIDPVGRLDPQYAGEWLAAAAPVGATGWLAVVQEKREVTVTPVDELRRVFVRAGVSSLGIFALLLGLLWYLIHRASA
jgi:hypothetical protein